MSGDNDNVTPIRPGPPPPEDAQTMIGLSFECGNGDPSRLFMALRGVCYAIEAIQGSADDLDQFVRLGVAAGLLVEQLEELEVSRPPYPAPP